MRQVYAHEAVLAPEPGADRSAPGQAITDTLNAHVASVEQDGQVLLRVLFAAAPDRVDATRDIIDAALNATDHWQLIRAGCTNLAAGERQDARRLLKG